MAKHRFFIAGTDTDAGKTAVAVGLLAAAAQRHLSTVAMKPVAAGCRETDQGLRNDDALKLQQASTLKLPYEQINPVALQPAIAPHIAAARAGRRVVVSQLAGFCRGVLMQPADVFLLEGAGGWRVPLNRAETLADLAKELRLPVILVVGVRLGCINHALLTVEAIARDGLPLAGWVANCCEPGMKALDENILALEQMIPAACLGVVPHLAEVTPAAVAMHLKTDLVITY